MESVSTENGYNNRQAHNYYLGYEEALVKRRANPSMAIEASWRPTRPHTSKVIVDSRQIGSTPSPSLPSTLFSPSRFLSVFPLVLALLLFFLQVALDGQARPVLPNDSKFGVRLSYYSQGLTLFWARAWPRHHRSSRGRAGDPGLSVEGACRKRRPYVVQHSIAAAYPQILGRGRQWLGVGHRKNCPSPPLAEASV